MDQGPRKKDPAGVNGGVSMAKDFSKKFYESTRWRKCAKAYATSKLFICERCHNRFIKRDGTRQRWIVHHKIPLTPDNIHDDMIAYNWDNLMFLCIECHNAIHGKKPLRTMQWDDDGDLIGIYE